MDFVFWASFCDFCDSEVLEIAGPAPCPVSWLWMGIESAMAGAEGGESGRIPEGAEGGCQK